MVAHLEEPDLDVVHIISLSLGRMSMDLCEGFTELPYQPFPSMRISFEGVRMVSFKGSIHIRPFPSMRISFEGVRMVSFKGSMLTCDVSNDKCTKHHVLQ